MSCQRPFDNVLFDLGRTPALGRKKWKKRLCELSTWEIMRENILKNFHSYSYC